MREWLEIRDFSQGMNQQNAITASEQPWDLQDVLISERPELRRRGPFTDRANRTSKDNLNLIPDYVLAASTYTFLGTSATIAVTADQRVDDNNNTVWAVCIWVIEANSAPDQKWFRVDGKATMADIAGAWTDPDGAADRLDNRPDAFIVTTDKGTFVMSYNSSNDFEWFQVASSYYDLSSNDNRLKGSGFRTCANVGGYTFLGGRFAKNRNDGGDSNAKAAGRRMWWSKAFNSERWKNKSGEIGSEGGSLVLPFTEAIRYFTELEGNLVIFTKNQIHTQSVPPGSEPTDWVLQQRADVGTLYPRSISRYEDSLIFANADGVYQFSGYETICLTEDSISELYRKQFYQEVLDDQNPEAPVQREVVGIVIGDYYLLSLNDETGYAFCLHIPTNSWVRFSNIPMLAASWTPAGDRRAFGFMRANQNNQPWTRIVRLDRMFIPDGSSQSSPAGLDVVQAPQGTRGPKMKLELRRYSQSGLGVPKLWRSLAVTYDAKALTGTAGQLNVSYSASPDKDDSSWTALTPLAATTSVKEVRQTLAATSSAIGVKVEESGSLGRMNLASIELGYKELRRGRA